MENGKFVDGQYCYSLQMFASECFMRYDKRLINIKFMDETFEVLMELWNDVKEFCQELVNFIFKSLHLSFLKFEARKGVMVTALNRKRKTLKDTDSFRNGGYRDCGGHDGSYHCSGVSGKKH